MERSPAFDAVKIRCRNRRTSASARRQSTWRQRSASSSGPLTTTAGAVAASSLSFGSGVSVIFFSTGSPDRVSTLSGPGTRPGIRPVIRDRRPGGASHRVPVSCCLSAAGIRFSVIPFPPRNWASPHGRPTGPDQPPGPRRGYRVPHARAATGVGAPYNPRTSGAHPAGSPPRPAPAASQRPVPKPRHDIPPREALLHGPSTGVHSRSPVRSSPRPRPRDGTGSASASP